MKQLFKYKVATQCFTYNHKSYIKETLEGFTIQQTDFPVAFIVVDDASTDGEPDFLRAWAETNLRLTDEIAYKKQMPYGELIFGANIDNQNLYFAILLLSENHYQTGRHDEKLKYISEWCNDAEYIAICEGDDYWIDPFKLQEQTDLLDDHSEYSLCFHAHKNLFLDGRFEEIKPQYIKNEYLPEDVIPFGGGFMATNSMLYRSVYLKEEGCPDFWMHSLVGDLPCQLFHISKGNFGYIDRYMSVYRVMAKGSWSEKNNKADTLLLMKKFKSNIRMYREYNQYTNGKYNKLIRRKIRSNKFMFYKRLLGSVYHSLFKH